MLRAQRRNLVAKRRRKGFWARLGRAVLLAVVAWGLLTVTAVVVLRWVNPPTTAFMLRDRVGAALG
ncbi:MAG TPA: hypothetical protein VLC53_06935, partial [Myxococcota bacterium]|nr:hypothetical protein [Myxococcota bacterium]